MVTATGSVQQRRRRGPAATIGAEAMATIQDVARRAQVSPATVSRVLNGSSTVHPDLMRRVQAAVQALGYQPNGVARSLRRRESSLLHSTTE